MNVDDHVRLNLERWKLVGLTTSSASKIDIAWRDSNATMITTGGREELHLDLWGDGSDKHFEYMLKLTRPMRHIERRIHNRTPLN